MKTLTLKVPEALDKELAGLARQRGSTKSAFVRQAIAELLPKGRRRGFVEAAGDLAGCLAGPRDLSSAARHMSGYGR